MLEEGGAKETEMERKSVFRDLKETTGNQRGITVLWFKVVDEIMQETEVILYRPVNNWSGQNLSYNLCQRKIEKEDHRR